MPCCFIYVDCDQLRWDEESIVTDAIQAIREFIGAEPPKNRAAWFVSNAVNGDHSVRQVNTYIEGWTVYTISQSKSLKLKHLASNNKASYLWVDDKDEHRRKNVWMKGTVDIVTDPDEVAAFLKRRQAAFGRPHQNESAPMIRHLIRFTPDYLRAESFVSHDMGAAPTVLKGADFTG